jgi:hypothetical protein
MSNFLREAAEARLQGIVDELHGLGFTVTLGGDSGRDVVVASPAAAFSMKLLPSLAAGSHRVADAGAGGASNNPPPPKKKRTPRGEKKSQCRFDGSEACDRGAITKGFCGMHYQQFKKGKLDDGGRPISPKA